jgi:NADPH2:quinone reductase
MRAVRFDEFGDYDVLRVVDVPRPVARPGEVVVRMRAAAVNPFDNSVRRGAIPQVTPPSIPGNEGMGVVVAGDGRPIDTRVMLAGPFGFGRPGTWQEYVVASPTEAIPVPELLTDVEAAAVPVAYQAAQLALMRGCALAPGMSLLIPGVGGSVANAAIQLAHAQGAGRVITSAGNTDKAERAAGMGYTDVIDLSHESLSAGVRRLTDGLGVDVALDTIGGPITGEAVASVGRNGLVVVMGYAGGTAPTIDVMHLIWKPARIAGFNGMFQPPQAQADAWSVILPLLSDGQVRPLIDRTYPLEQAAEASRHLAEDRPFGKVVLTL